MKTRYFFIIGILLFLAGGLTPPIYRRFVAEPADRDSSEILLLCITALLVITSMVFILAGVVRLNNDRSANDGLRIDSPD